MTRSPTTSGDDRTGRVGVRTGLQLAVGRPHGVDVRRRRRPTTTRSPERPPGTSGSPGGAERPASASVAARGNATRRPVVGPDDHETSGHDRRRLHRGIRGRASTGPCGSRDRSRTAIRRAPHVHLTAHDRRRRLHRTAGGRGPALRAPVGDRGVVHGTVVAADDHGVAVDRGGRHHDVTGVERATAPSRWPRRGRRDRSRRRSRGRR